MAETRKAEAADAPAGTRAGSEERTRSLATYGAGVLAAALVVKLVVFHATCVFTAAFSFASWAMGLVTDCCIVVAVCALLLLLRRRWVRFGVVAAMNVLLTVLAYANVVHFRFYGDVIAIHEFGMMEMVDDATQAVSVLLGLFDILFFLDWMVVGVWAGFRIAFFPAGGLVQRMRGRLARSPRGFPLGLAGGALAVTALVQVLWRPLDVPEPLRTAEIMSRSSMIVYYVTGTARAAVGARPKVERVTLLEEVCTCGRAGTGPSGGARRPGVEDVGPNFLLVQVESLNPEALRSDVMPNLSALAERGMLFTNFHSFAYLALTFRGEYTIMTSLYPPVGPMTTWRTAGPLNEGKLVDRLRSAGYATWFFHGYIGSFYNRRANYRAWGIENFYVREELAELGYKAGSGFGDRAQGPGIDDAEMSRAVPAILSKTARPYFAIYVTLDSHFPYTIPEGEEGERGLRSGTDDPHDYRPAYRRMMGYVDRELGGLFEGLRSRGLLENTYVFVYADHRGRTKRGAKYHEQLASPTAARLAAFVERHRVPCIILGPGIEPSRVEMHSSHLDIGPTVLELAGLAPPAASMGRSLLGGCVCRVWGLPTLTDAVVLTGPGRVGLYNLRDRRFVLYDTAKGRPVDPGPTEELRYRAVISRALYSDWVFMREGREVKEAGGDPE
jgi:phosphoglycerol transferase MdoB-like AlkP superfamily enzyme